MDVCKRFQKENEVNKKRQVNNAWCTEENGWFHNSMSRDTGIISTFARHSFIVVQCFHPKIPLVYETSRISVGAEAVRLQNAVSNHVCHSRQTLHNYIEVTLFLGWTEAENGECLRQWSPPAWTRQCSFLSMLKYFTLLVWSALIQEKKNTLQVTRPVIWILCYRVTNSLKQWIAVGRQQFTRKYSFTWKMWFVIDCYLRVNEAVCVERVARWYAKTTTTLHRRTKALSGPF